MMHPNCKRENDIVLHIRFLPFIQKASHSEVVQRFYF